MMKKERLKGFILGAAVTCTAMGLIIHAAAGRSIQVGEDGIGITINNANFTPRDPNGVVVDTFVYDGTTYVPMRAICEAIGLDVEYDSASNTARITQKGVDTSYITADAAKKAAFDNAGVSAPAVSRLECELEWDDGRAIYEIEFRSGTAKYEYEVDALTGKIVYENQKQAASGGTAAGTGGNADYITAEAAKKAAFDDAGVTASDAGKLKCDLERDDGRVIYEIEFQAAGVRYDYEIDARTGAVLDREPEKNTGGNADASYITAEQAKNTAINDAGVQASDVTMKKCKLDRDDGRMVYDIEFQIGRTEYEYEIDALTGRIVDKDVD